MDAKSAAFKAAKYLTFQLGCIIKFSVHGQLNTHDRTGISDPSGCSISACACPTSKSLPISLGALHTQGKPLCALRGSREMAPKIFMNCPMLDQDATRPLSPADSMGEAVKPLLGASKDTHECEDWVSASCKMHQQPCHEIQLNTEPKAPKAPSAAQPSCPNLPATGTFQNSQPTSFMVAL